MATTTTSIKDYVNNFLSQAASEEWDHDYIIQAWNEKDIKALVDVIQPIKKESSANDSNKPKKTRKKSSPKNSNKPKKAKTAYLYFCDETRVEVKKEMGDVNPHEVTREVGVRWKTLKESSDETDKNNMAKFVKMSSDDKVRASEEMETYVPQSDLSVDVSPSDLSVDVSPSDLSVDVSPPSDLSVDVIERGIVIRNDVRSEIYRKVSTAGELLVVMMNSPSTATLDNEDRTTEKLNNIVRHNGYGAYYLLNIGVPGWFEDLQQKSLFTQKIIISWGHTIRDKKSTNDVRKKIAEHYTGIFEFKTTCHESMPTRLGNETEIIPLIWSF
jgi:hypothetical protein